MPDPSTPLMFSQLEGLYQAFGPLAEALLRVSVGLALVPHGLRNTFGCFPTTGQPLRSLRMLADYMDEAGLSPGDSMGAGDLDDATHLRAAAGPRPVHAPRRLCRSLFSWLVSNIERWRVGKYFWNQLGFEYTLMWTIAALYFLVHDGGAYSFDNLIMGREF